MSKVTVMIVDDHTLIRDSWSLLLSLDDKYAVVANVGDGQAAIDTARELRPQVLLLDINMTPISGFEILKMVRKFLPGTKVIGVSMHTQPAYAKKMLRAGARGYVTKNSSSIELLKAIEEVVAGKIYLCDEVKNLLAEQTMNEKSGAAGISSLSEREMEIIRYIRDGFSSREIGEKIFISGKTVEVHRHNILQKLNVKNSASLIEYVNVQGL